MYAREKNVEEPERLTRQTRKKLLLTLRLVVISIGGLSLSGVLAPLWLPPYLTISLIYSLAMPIAYFLISRTHRIWGYGLWRSDLVMWIVSVLTILGNGGIQFIFCHILTTLGIGNNPAAPGYCTPIYEPAIPFHQSINIGLMALLFWTFVRYQAWRYRRHKSNQ